MILDDCFSGLDATTEDRIFTRLLGRNGLLKKNEVTVILVTHAAHRLSYADNIIILNEDGRVSEQGTYQHLVQHGTYIRSLLIQQKIQSEIADAEETSTKVGSFRTPAQTDEIARAAADINRPVGDWQTYLFYARSCGWINTICFTIGMIGFGVFMRMPGKT